tara:strand:+ start:411 stop:1523 length:1113 start_codon:yes stop_codon:yes gene_type:complete
MKTLDAHIFSLVEDPNLTFRELISIVDAVSRNQIRVDEKVDGQNFTVGFRGGEFGLMSKGSTNFTKIKTVHDLKNEIFYLSHMPTKKSGRLIQIKKMFLSHLANLNRNYKKHRPEINDGAIIECAMISSDAINLVGYGQQHEGLIVLDLIDMENNNEIFKSLGLQRLASLDYETDTNWGEELTQFLSSFGCYSLDSKIGEFATNQVKPILLDMGLPTSEIDAFASRIGFKDKQLASHRKLSKQNWKKFQIAEKSWYLYRKAVQPIDLVLYKMLEDIFQNSTNLMEIETRIEDVAISLDNILCSEPKGDPVEVQKFLYEKELIQPYLYFDHLNEGVVFTWNEKRYKITGAFTPINKINGFTLYKSEKIQFK